MNQKVRKQPQAKLLEYLTKHEQKLSIEDVIKVKGLKNKIKQ